MRFAFTTMALFCGVVAGVAAPWDVAAVRQRVAELQPRPEEKRFDEIGWARDIREARRLAAQHHRPIFLFTHDGRMNIGRC
jgi:hypothetical protein